MNLTADLNFLEKPWHEPELGEVVENDPYLKKKEVKTHF